MKPDNTVSPRESRQSASFEQEGKRIILALMIPMLMMVLSASMFGISLPTLREAFGLEADMVAWLETAYALPMMLLMPLYGQLGDGIGKRRLFMAGVSIFLFGTLVITFSSGLPLALLGRVFQGIGAGSVNPLCIAIISERFSSAKRGSALGTWNSAGPLGGLAGPPLGGLIVDSFGWRAIFVVVIVLGGFALLALKTGIPAADREFISPGYFKSFDGIGFVFLAIGVASFIVFTSSRPITGVEALQDWRLLGISFLFLAILVVWEKRHANPFLPLNLFGDKVFMVASLGSSLRLWTLSSAAFLNTLYLTDIWLLNATNVGLVKMLVATGLLLTMQFGGKLADQWGSRQPVVIGMVTQGSALLLLVFLSPFISLPIAIGLLVLQGLGAGLSLAALHRSAMGRVKKTQLGAASGLYGMIRASGMVIGIALVGVLLRTSLNRLSDPLMAYQISFGFIAGAAWLGAILGTQLKEAVVSD